MPINTSQPRRPFGSPGTSTRGVEVSGYTAGRYHTILKTSDGRTILDSRCDVATSYPNVEDGPTYALVFALPRGRWIVGYALGMQGMLFRGELRTDCADESEARLAARDVAERLIQRDAEDSAAFDARESDDDPEEICDECGQSMYRDCNGYARCDECDPPCPCCSDGGGPGPGADDESDDESESDDDGPSDPPVGALSVAYRPDDDGADEHTCSVTFADGRDVVFSGPGRDEESMRRTADALAERFGVDPICVFLDSEYD